MDEIGDNFSESLSEEERREERQEIMKTIDVLAERIDVLDDGEERRRLQVDIDIKKKELFNVSNDKERIERIEEFLEEHEMMYEMSDGEYAVTLDSILTPWGEVPKWRDLSSYIKEELLRVKSENPWIQDSDYEKGE